MIALIVDGALSFIITLTGLLVIGGVWLTLKAEVRSWTPTARRAAKLARARAARQAVYAEAEEARRKHVETRMVNRRLERDRWVERFVEAGGTGKDLGIEPPKKMRAVDAPRPAGPDPFWNVSVVRNFTGEEWYLLPTGEALDEHEMQKYVQMHRR